MSVAQKGTEFWAEDDKAIQPGRRAISLLVDVPVRFTQEIPHETPRKFYVLHAKVLSSSNRSFTWALAAEEFTFW